jgi:hypothetical protein
MRTHLLALVSLLLVSCARAPTPEQIASADYGPEPQDPQSIAEEWVKGQLVDPYSAHFTHGPLVKGYTHIFSNIAYGWIECGWVNAKNSMGGYTGMEPYFVTIHNSVVVQGYVDNPTEVYVRPAESICKNFYGRS